MSSYHARINNFTLISIILFPNQDKSLFKPLPFFQCCQQRVWTRGHQTEMTWGQILAYTVKLSNQSEAVAVYKGHICYKGRLMQVNIYSPHTKNILEYPLYLCALVLKHSVNCSRWEYFSTEITMHLFSSLMEKQRKKTGKLFTKMWVYASTGGASGTLE